MKISGVMVGITAFIAALRLMAGGEKKPEGVVDRLLLVGDSLAVGLAAPLRARAVDAGFEYRALAKNSTRIDQWASSAELDQAIADFKPTVVFISLGTNDDALGVGAVEKQRAALRKLLEKISGKGPDLVWIGSLKPGPVSAMVAGMLGDIYFHSERLGLPKSSDGLHTTPAGYSEWAAKIWSGNAE